MKSLITTFVKYPFYANIIIAILIFAGGFSILKTKKSFFPERTSKFINVSVSYPGASPKEMEEGITTRIEEALRGIVGIKEITSNSFENFARVSIETTGQFDLDETLMEVKNAVDGISAMPIDAERPIVSKSRSFTQAIYLGLSGDVDLSTLKKYAQEIEDDFYASGIMSQISLQGFPNLEISVEVTEEDLLRYNISFDEISRAISQNNRDISAGMIKSDEEEILIRSRSRSVKPANIGEIILRANNDGSFIRIRDIATVKNKFADVSSLSLMNGKNAVYIMINKLNNEDLEEISVFCNAYVEKFNKIHKGIELIVTFDFLGMLNSRLDMLLSNGGLGLILVIVTLALFLSFRLSLWVAWGIPSAFLAMFIVANLYGITINMISLFGMILVIGILVDDGIVIGENIFTHYEKGKTPKQAAIDGTMEVLPAVTTSVSTTIIAFTPILFLSGRMEFLREMAFVVIVSLFFSLIEAFFVLPAHLASPHILRRKSRKSKIRKILEKFINFMKNKIYGRILKIIIKWKWIAVTMPVFFLFLTIGLIQGGFIKYTIFPAIPFDMFKIDIAFKPSDGEKQTFKYLQKFDKIVWQVNDELQKEFEPEEEFIQFTFLNLGSAFDGQENGSHAGHIQIMLGDLEGAPISSFEISRRIQERIPFVKEAEKFKIGAENRFGKPVSISILSKNLNELTHAKKFLKDGLLEIPTLKDIVDNDAAGKQEIRIKLKDKAYFLGLDHASISNQIRQGFFGGQVQRLQNGKDELRVWVRYPKEDRLNVGQLENMKIKTQKGIFFLKDLVDYHLERGPVNIRRFNSSREIRIDADLLDPYSPIPAIMEQIKNDIIKPMKLKYKGVSVLYQGQSKSGGESIEDMKNNFSIAFAVILLLLMLHFKSVSQSFIILLMIPLAWIGAIWGHGLEGIPISMLSAWGMVALSGVIINDAVVFLAKYNSLILEGNKVEEAAYNAGISRFRAIILTTITTSVGLYPLIFEKSFQAQFLKPMAASLAYGVFIGTALILLIFPPLILVLIRLKFYLYKTKFFINWFWIGEKPNIEEKNNEDLEIAIINKKRNIEIK